jgi:hypothetical protein
MEENSFPFFSLVTHSLSSHHVVKILLKSNKRRITVKRYVKWH